MTDATSTTPAPAPAAAASDGTAAAASDGTADVAKKDNSLFPDGAPPAKKSRIESLLERDPSLKHILERTVGTKDSNFLNGILYMSTLEKIKELWNRLDFVKEGVLKQIHFQTVRGIDPMWGEFLDRCDVDGDGNIRPPEFVAGFLFAAMEKQVCLNMPPGGTTTGFEVLKSLEVMINEHVLAEVAAVERAMGWSS